MINCPQCDYNSEHIIEVWQHMDDEHAVWSPCYTVIPPWETKQTDDRNAHMDDKWRVQRGEAFGNPIWWALPPTNSSHWMLGCQTWRQAYDYVIKGDYYADGDDDA